MIGNTVIIHIKGRFYGIVIVSDCIVVIVIIEINRYAVIIGIGQRIDTAAFQYIENTVVIIVNIYIIFYVVIIVVIGIFVIVQIIRNTVAIRVNCIIRFIISVRVRIFINSQNSIIIVIHIEIIRNAVTISIVISRVTILGIMVINCYIFKNC